MNSKVPLGLSDFSSLSRGVAFARDLPTIYAFGELPFLEGFLR